MADQLVFRLDPDQRKMFDEWAIIQDAKVAARQGKQWPCYGAIGGGYTFHLTPTGIGMIVTAENAITKETLNLTGVL